MSFVKIFQSRRLTLLLGIVVMAVLIVAAGTFLGLAIYMALATMGTIYVYSITQEPNEGPSDFHGIGLSMTGIVFTFALLFLWSLEPGSVRTTSLDQGEVRNEAAADNTVQYPESPYAGCGGLSGAFEVKNPLTDC